MSSRVCHELGSKTTCGSSDWFPKQETCPRQVLLAAAWGGHCDGPQLRISVRTQVSGAWAPEVIPSAELYLFRSLNA